MHAVFIARENRSQQVNNLLNCGWLDCVQYRVLYPNGDVTCLAVAACVNEAQAAFSSGQAPAEFVDTVAAL